MPVLLIAEHDDLYLSKATLCAITAAQKIGEPVTLFITGSNIRAIAERATTIPGIEKVRLIDAPFYGDFGVEKVSDLIAYYASHFGYDYIIGPASGRIKDILPRVAGRYLAMERDIASCITDITEIKSADVFVRPINADSFNAEIQSVSPIKILTVRPTSFKEAPITGGQAEIDNSFIFQSFRPDPGDRVGHCIKLEIIKSERPDIAEARFVVSGGRGLSSKEEFERLVISLADRLGAAIGASRAAVDAGYVSNDCQVGQTGKVIAPELYVAIGISGQIQHLAGMKDSKVIVAINKDPDAPIFQVADYGLVADCREAVPEILDILSRPENLRVEQPLLGAEGPG